MHRSIAKLATDNFINAKSQVFFSRTAADAYVYSTCDERTIVYCDGSYSRNLSLAGFGCFFGFGDNRNCFGRVMGYPISSSRAERFAMLMSLLATNCYEDLEIRTDCLELILHLTLSKRHERTRCPILDMIRLMMEKRAKKVIFTYVKSHAYYRGNIIADRFAKKGCLLTMN